ncbi:hypothetical protein HN014_10570 [Aquimarina sp. TRL1]|uniref:hypothetical protein n=1 Tax=Aquimarina sp. (strain TRL1) TaxID=2736252 RepID=UPI00158EC4E0|nr:hypothetical protein [Aquimarina sp. TRL1]QKX05340.1 hypothetical protein HN014_10570 [Aquimarina sp. TRL1]
MRKKSSKVSSKPKKQYFKKDSLYVMRVYFQDGGKRSFYSRDWKNERSATKNYHIGFSRYRKLIHNWGDKARTILIFHRPTDTLVAKYYKGAEVPITKQ